MYRLESLKKTDGNWLGRAIFLLTLFSSLLGQLQAEAHRPKVGLVLAGGGALGFAHVGVLKVLQEEHIPVDYVAGTSMGAIVGAAYAAGRTVDDMKEVLSNTNWDSLFNDGPAREDLPYRFKGGRDGELVGDAKLGFKDGKIAMPSAAIAGQNLLPVLRNLYAGVPSPVDFDRLPVPYRAVAANIETGRAVIIKAGDLAVAARASMSVPGVFGPVEINGEKLVDGGIANNLPVDITLGMGADVLIVVELYADLRKANELDSMFAISGQIISLLLQQNSELQHKLIRSQDILLEPNLKGYSSTSFDKARELMAQGEEAARAAVGRLRKLSIPAAEYEAYEAARTQERNLTPRIDFVRIENRSSVPDAFIKEKVSSQLGEPFNREKVEEDIRKIHALGPFSLVTYSLTTDPDGKQGLVVSAAEKEWYHDYVRFGLSLQDDFKGDSSYSLAASYRHVIMQNYGNYVESQLEIGRNLQWKIELYQPLGASSPYFVLPAFKIGRRDLYVQHDGDLVAQYERGEGDLSLKLGRQLGSNGEIWAGIARGKGRLDRHIGDPDLPEFDYDIGQVETALAYDSLNKPDFPTSGLRSKLGFLSSAESLGATDNYNQLGGIAVVPYSWDRNTLIFAGDFGWSMQDLPVEHSFSLGGFTDISGYVPNSLLASDYEVGRAVYFRRFSEIGGSLFGLGFYLGGTCEVANLHSDIAQIPSEPLILAGSVFLGADTPIAPIYLAFGLNDQHEQAIYFVFGRLPGVSRR